MKKNGMNAERQRLREADAGVQPWRLWGPYLSERQWGTGGLLGARDGVGLFSPRPCAEPCVPVG